MLSEIHIVKIDEVDLVSLLVNDESVIVNTSSIDFDIVLKDLACGFDLNIASKNTTVNSSVTDDDILSLCFFYSEFVGIDLNVREVVDDNQLDIAFDFTFIYELYLLSFCLVDLDEAEVDKGFE